MINNFKVWTKYKDEIIIYDNNKNQFEIDIIPPLNINSFYLPKAYEMKKKDRQEISDDDYTKYLKNKLVEYSINLIKDVKEIKEYDNLKIHFDYFDNEFKIKNDIYYRSHQRNVRTFLKRLLKDESNKYKYVNYDDVYYSEYKWFKLCYNSGLTYLKEEGKYQSTHGYDFRMSYPTDMADISFQIPTKKGKEIIIKEFSNNIKFIQYGIYRVKIQSDDENFKKVFMFSSQNGYTSYSVKFALKMKKKYNITIELIQDGQPNAYVYDKKDLISGNKLFGNWYHRLLDMKKDMPKNGIVKLLSSSAWGHINELKTIKFNEQELLKFINDGNLIGSEDMEDEVDYIIVDMKPTRNTTLYELVKKNKPIYELPIRLLPFITSFSRCKMGNLINKYDLFEKLIRIHTDSMTLTEEFNEPIKNLFRDAKISGDINFKSLNNYSHLIFDEI